MWLLNREALVIAYLEMYVSGDLQRQRGERRIKEKASQAFAFCISISATEASLLNVRQIFLTSSFYKVFEKHCTVLNYFQYFIFLCKNDKYIYSITMYRSSVTLQGFCLEELIVCVKSPKSTKNEAANWLTVVLEIWIPCTICAYSGQLVRRKGSEQKAQQAHILY